MKTVWINGCFDLFHVGHLDLIQQAAAMGDWLIVGINNDESVKALKGDSKPIISYKHRRMIVEAIDGVSQIVEIRGKRCIDELLAIQPDVVVKGKGYTIETMCQDEREAIEGATGYGGRIVFLDVPGKLFCGNMSTGEIIDRCKKCD